MRCGGDPRPQSPLMCSSFKRTSRTRVVRMAGAVRGGRPSSEPSFTSLQQTLTARPRSAHQAREQSLSVGECDRVVDITPLTVWPLTFMLAHKAVPHGCRHLLFTSMCSTIPTSPDSGLTSRCSWTAKATPPPPLRFQQPSFPSLFGMPYGHSFHASS